MKENNHFLNKLIVAYVLYNPPEEIEKKIKMFLEKNIEVYVFENSKSNLNLKDNNLFLFGNQTNQGLGLALNEIEKKALENKKEFIFYLDQDTHITNQIFNLLIFYQQYLVLDSKCISINLKDNNDSLFKKVPITINSASLFHLKKLEKIGLHSGKIFLDGIDFEFSLRARKKGFVLLKGKSFNSIDHNVNQDENGVKIFGKSHVLFKKYSKSRYFNIINISLKLLVKSIIAIDILYALEMLKFIVIFVSLQALNPIIKTINEKFSNFDLK